MAASLLIGSSLFRKYFGRGHPALVYTALFVPILTATGIALWQYTHYNNPGDVDTSAFTTAFWNLAHGNLHISLWNANLFSDHSNYLSILFVPVFIAAGNTGLIITQSLLILLTVVVLIKPLTTNDISKVFIVSAIVFSPPIFAILLYGFHGDVLGAPFLALALWAYKENKICAFVLLTIALAFAKEVFVLGAGGLIALALIERRNWRWILLPLLAGSIAIAMYWYGVLPILAKSGNRVAWAMPNGIGQWLALILRKENAWYVFTVLFPLIPLFAVTSWKYIVLPLPFMLFYAGFPDPSFRVVFRQYSFPIAIMCWGTLLLGENEKLKRLSPVLFLTVALAYPSWKPLVNPTHYDRARVKDIPAVTAMISHNASLLVHAACVSQFVDRKEVNNWIYRNKPIDQFEYALFDSRFLPQWWNDTGSVRSTIDLLRESPAWETKYSANGLYLFKNKMIGR
ncbi:MAG: hypothetical protein A2248_10920 [Candidatus Raymondbacteria bacterium RIFOXYA2_FULL_49_16]|uniref:Glycosyltransferase RgtA/B/C/D-like domain-containing protein n=1 Tax=Candidatus Raymondbacteria bacterium RIFOXYD12_FULL_49_13 TaxID=1817890 RepID=A0A1F7F4Y6_UNCRA|nr:MAG: hypothetical protein A2248_10920 [Candidatus Raymondbacteria bacterium RIFOXYA2_FULL_49_16]OGJ98544.1 MAG: hypothetical protein A2453_06720 [Candidatus Raymondbacteria bacterium RIFOXYC2_FULL_50_21]OGK01597.1 MAG: hypothetical protein A2519_06010 [Candidatus Raymondbacteria bacterium RIFOXYD12_FULL_49_13]OGP44213.1 MAG: hypothetical protein A2324_06845 [Candidatus Raymondbacteria bacterium RIFOXYB2_FULL_49_35]